MPEIKIPIPEGAARSYVVRTGRTSHDPQIRLIGLIAAVSAPGRAPLDLGTVGPTLDRDITRALETLLETIDKAAAPERRFDVYQAGEVMADYLPDARNDNGIGAALAAFPVFSAAAGNPTIGLDELDAFLVAKLAESAQEPPTPHTDRRPIES